MGLEGRGPLEPHLQPQALMKTEEARLLAAQPVGGQVQSNFPQSPTEPGLRLSLSWEQALGLAPFPRAPAPGGPPGGNESSWGSGDKPMDTQQGSSRTGSQPPALQLWVLPSPCPPCVRPLHYLHLDKWSENTRASQVISVLPMPPSPTPGLPPLFVLSAPTFPRGSQASRSALQMEETEAQVGCDSYTQT